jgi:hypothetical protein
VLAGHAGHAGGLPSTTESQATRSAWRAVLSSGRRTCVDSEAHPKHARVRRHSGVGNAAGEANLIDSVQHPRYTMSNTRKGPAVRAGP